MPEEFATNVREEYSCLVSRQAEENSPGLALIWQEELDHPADWGVNRGRY